MTAFSLLQNCMKFRKASPITRRGDSCRQRRRKLKPRVEAWRNPRSGWLNGSVPVGDTQISARMCVAFWHTLRASVAGTPQPQRRERIGHRFLGLHPRLQYMSPLVTAAQRKSPRRIAGFSIFYHPVTPTTSSSEADATPPRAGGELKRKSPRRSRAFLLTTDY